MSISNALLRNLLDCVCPILKNKVIKGASRIEVRCQQINILSEDQKIDKIFGWELTSRLKVLKVGLDSNHVIPILEKLNLIEFYDDLVVNQIFNFLSNKENLLNQNGKIIFINLSRDSLNNTFVNKLIEISKKYNLIANLICFEMTETSEAKKNFADDYESIKSAIKSIISAGYKIALDDWHPNTSIGIEHWFQWDFIKVKRSLREESLHGWQYIINHTRSRSIPLIIENIASKEDVAIALKEKIKIGQGFYFHKPCPLFSEPIK